MSRIKLDRQQIIRLLDGYPCQVATEVGMLEFEAVQNEWEPLTEYPPTPEIVEAHRINNLPSEIEVWANRTYEVVVTRPLSEGVADEDAADMTQLSIKRYDRAPCHNWRHLQQMKNEICGDDWEAIEVYPDESRLVDTANQTFLFAVPYRLPLGFGEGFVRSEEQADEYNKEGHKGRQEPRQPGLTTGEKLQGKPLPEFKTPEGA